MGYLSEEQLQNLRNYKYSGVDKSFVSRYILQPYWNRLVQLFPLWVAPNLITLIGFCCILINLATVLAYDYDLSGECPRWAYFTFALGFFIYQSFDAIDGKQARRTGTSGPLGELFDHGCDALNTSIGAIIVAETLQLRQSWWTAASLFTAGCNFYLSTWEEYHTGVLYLSYFSGPVEGVLLIIGTMILTGILGPSIWLTTIQELFGLDDATSEIATKGQLNHIMVILSAITLLYNILSSIYNAVKAKKHSRKDLTYTLLGLVPYFAGSALAYLWLLASPTILTEYLVPFMLYTGITLGYIVGQIILAHVTDSKFPFFSIVYIPLVLGVINAAFPALFDVEIIPTSHEYIYVYVCLGIAVLIYAHFAYSVIREICNFLDIYCLRIKPKPRDETKMV